jgi:hypothetical protein
MKYGNCYVWAVLEYRKLKRQWREKGAFPLEEPYFVSRASRHSPRWVKHYMVGQLNPGTNALEVRSFKPVSPVDVPWWLAWTRLWFEGRVVVGDFHDF